MRGCGLKSGCRLHLRHFGWSPSVRGCGLKCPHLLDLLLQRRVTLRARVWVEMAADTAITSQVGVTLRARVWVEIPQCAQMISPCSVTLRARVWVEISTYSRQYHKQPSPSVRGCGLKLNISIRYGIEEVVTLRARVWVEMFPSLLQAAVSDCHPPCEGVG